jgi:hypothetical protein
MRDSWLPTSIGIVIMLKRSISVFLRSNCFAVKLTSRLSFNEVYLMSNIQRVTSTLQTTFRRFGNDFSTFTLSPLFVYRWVIRGEQLVRSSINS